MIGILFHNFHRNVLAVSKSMMHNFIKLYEASMYPYFINNLLIKIRNRREFDQMTFFISEDDYYCFFSAC